MKAEVLFACDDPLIKALVITLFVVLGFGIGVLVRTWTKHSE